MRVIRATAMGMCFGVRDALVRAFRIHDPASVTILGELVHNEEVLAGLADRGFPMTPESDRGDLPSFTVVSGPEAVEPLPHARLGVVFQTTTPPVLAAATARAIRASNPRSDVRVVLTVCRPTRERQDSLARLFGRVDAVERRLRALPEALTSLPARQTIAP